MGRHLMLRVMLWLLVILSAITVIGLLPQTPLPALLSMLWLGTALVLSRQQRRSAEPATLHKVETQQHARRVVQMSTLNKVLALLTETLSPDSVLDTVISSASAISEATAISVYLLREGTPNLVRSAGMSDVFDSPRPLLNLAEQQSDPGQPIVIENVYLYSRAAHLREQMAREGKSSWIELPLWVAGRGLGVVILYFDGPAHLRQLRPSERAAGSSTRQRPGTDLLQVGD